MESSLEDIKNLVLEISKTLEEIIEIFNRMRLLAESFDAMAAEYQKLTFGENLGPNLIPILKIFQKTFSRFIPHINELTKYQFILRNVKEKSENWFIFLHAVQPRDLLDILKKIKDSYNNLKEELSLVISLYKRIKRFSEEFKTKYKGDFELFLDIEGKLSNAITRAEHLAELYYKEERAIVDKIQKLLSKREFIKVNLNQLDPSLQGTITLVIIFDVRGRSVEFVHYDKYPEDWSTFFVYFNTNLGVSFVDIFLYSKRLFEVWINYFIREEGRFLRQVFLQDKINVTLSIYIMDKLRERGFTGHMVKEIFSPSGMGVKIVVGSDQRNWRIYLNVKKLSGMLYDYIRNDPAYLQSLSGFVVHELSHIMDKNVNESRNVLDKFRIEGIAMFSEYISNPRNLMRFGFSIRGIQKYFYNPINSIQEVIKLYKEREADIYNLGFYFCLVIFASDILRKFGIKPNPLDIEAFSRLLEKEEYYSHSILYIRLIRQMKTKFFINRYIQETARLGLPLVFTNDLIQRINEVL